VTTLYGIKSCDTVRKANKWLTEAGVTFVYHDFRIDGLTISHIEKWLKHVPWNTLLNTRSTSWRQLDQQSKSELDESKAVRLMLDNPTLIKRPVLEYTIGKDDAVDVGFKQQRYQELFLGVSDDR